MHRITESFAFAGRISRLSKKKNGGWLPPLALVCILREEDAQIMDLRRRADDLPDPGRLSDGRVTGLSLGAGVPS